MIIADFQTFSRRNLLNSSQRVVRDDILGATLGVEDSSEQASTKLWHSSETNPFSDPSANSKQLESSITKDVRNIFYSKSVLVSGCILNLLEQPASLGIFFFARPQWRVVEIGQQHLQATSRTGPSTGISRTPRVKRITDGSCNWQK